MSPPNQQFYRDEHLFVDLLKQVVTLDSEILALTRMEYRLLAVLVKHAGEVVPQPILLMLTLLVDVHLWRLRKKLGKYANQYIENGHRCRVPFPASSSAQGLGFGVAKRLQRRTPTVVFWPPQLGIGAHQAHPKKGPANLLPTPQV